MLKTKIKFLLGMMNREVSIIGGLAVVVVAVLAFGALYYKLDHKVDDGKSIGYIGNNSKNKNISRHAPIVDSNQFVVPEDAGKSGKVAIIVDNLDTAKSAVANVAKKNGGNVFKTFIAYSSDNIKNGSIVIQVPAYNFDSAFADLKKIGNQVVQESTEQIPLRNVPYAYPVPSERENNLGSETANDNVASGKKAEDEDQNVNNIPSSAPAEMPLYYSVAQDKGYIKVIFADYGKNESVKSGSANGLFFSSVSYFDFSEMLVVIAIKSIFLIVLLAVLIIIAKKIIKSFRKNKNKPAVHVVKQASKIGAKAVKTKKVVKRRI